MTNSIPVSPSLVSTVPSVLSAGGNPLSPNGVMLTEDTSIPIGTVQSFPSAAAVSAWFGANSQEAKDAAVYFSGFTIANRLPGLLYFAQFNAGAVDAYLRGASVAGIPLATLQALAGVLTIAIDGRTVTSANINLSSGTSPSVIAGLIQTGLQTAGGIFSGTGTVTNGSPTLTINTTVSGQLHIGDVVVGTDIPGGTTITAFGTYTVLAGTGTVTMSANASGAAGPEAVTVSSTATVTYDSQRAGFVVSSPTTGVNSTIAFPTTDAFVTGLQLTSATGAVLSQGAAAAVPGTFMNGVVAAQQNWVAFMTVFEPDGGAEPPTNKLLFAAWTSQTSPAGAGRFAYVAWDPDKAPTTGTAAGSFGALVAAAGYNGIFPMYDQSSGLKAAFILGCVASIDQTEAQGRITFAYKSQAGLVPDVTDATTAANLIANGYNFYGQYASATQQFQLSQQGSTPGSWQWFDAYIDQILLNVAIVQALITLLTNTKSLPYNQRGYNLIRSALLDPITTFLNFGAIQPGVQLSNLQAQEMNSAANATIAPTVQNTGYYLQILPALPTSRTARTSPPITIWYTDGGSIQQINVASIDVQ